MVQYDYHTKIYYKDIDQMGVVYYARYFEYFEQARTELLNGLGIILTDIEDEGFFLPVVSATCDYKKGARFEDEIIVRTMIKDLPRARMKIEYEVYRKKDNQLLVTGYTIHGFIDKEGKPKRPPKALVEKLSSAITG
ncbi:MAG: thioesterase family protein [Candidatus Marinimicrobia bacterium]|jgi:acyl-CoA thioester hydrolase|nr:thioesterase family protein [Candidatus Neomarinimicrobiota bacterium]|tara:strand:- start:16230 stop:16640 length:411 start_codon:yes stop_codon:yes gene_type:complete